MLLAALGVLVLASTTVGLFMALTQKPPAWFFLSFELVVVLGAVFLVMLGMGRYKEGPAITLLCCAGAIGVCTLLGWQASGKQLNGQSITWLVLLRGGIAGLLVLAAAADVALRNPSKTLPRIGWGLAVGVPLVAVLVLFQRGTLAAIIAKVSGGSQSFGFGIWLLIGLLACALASASGHLLITGFQIGVRGEQKKTEPPPPAAKPRPATPPAPTGTPSGAKG